MSPRYAVYLVPSPDTTLWSFGTGIIGYDSIEGRLVDRPKDVSGLLASELMAEPARYGFHATLRAPFELSPGSSPSDLLSAVARCATQLQPLTAGLLRLELMGGFVALVCERMPQELVSLAATCVVHVEHLRAPLSEADRDRRLAAGLTSRQTELLDRWGYPYVHDQFKFHMTLTGRLPERDRRPVLAKLREIYEPIASPLVISEISVLAQERRDARFCVLKRFPLGR